jgi:alkylhydroperoxidase/carboxymuconolactone decarboxylase family protein YurZ
MRISETAIRNHEELFPNHRSTLQDTDPELIEVFDNFAFDEVLQYGNLDKKTRMMVILASLIAQQTLSEYKVMLNGALNIGLTPVEAKEIVYQAVPYCGIAKVLDFLHATNDILRDRGVELPLPGQSTTAPETRYEKGLAVQKSIFGKMIDDMYEAAQRLLCRAEYGLVNAKARLPEPHDTACIELIAYIFLEFVSPIVPPTRPYKLMAVDRDLGVYAVVAGNGK